MRGLLQSPSLAWLALGLHAGIIFALSSRSNLPMPLPFPHADKIAHFTTYFLFGWLAAHAIQTLALRKSTFLLTLLLGAAYAASDEIHQAFVPRRHADIMDWLADMLGVALAAYVYRSARDLVIRRGWLSSR